MAETQAHEAPDARKTHSFLGTTVEENNSEKHRGRPRNRPIGPNGYPMGQPGEDGSEVTDFFAQLRTYSKEDWEQRLLCYLYRFGPMIKLKRGEWAIDRFQVPFDQHDIMLKHGSGGYKAILVSFNQQTQKTTQVRTELFNVLNTDYPPRVPIGTWIDDPQNADWLWAKPLLEAEYKKNERLARMQSAGDDAATSGGDASLFRAAVDAVKELRPNSTGEEQNGLAAMVIQTVREQGQQMMAMNNPTGMLSIVEKVLGVVTDRKEQGGGLIELFSTQLAGVQAELQAERAFARELLKQATEARENKGRSAEDELTRFKTIADTFGFSRKNQSTGSEWAPVARDVGVEIIKGLSQVGVGFIQWRNQKEAREHAEKNAGKSGVGQAPAPAPVAAAPQIPAAQAPQPSPAAQPTPQEQTQMDQAQMVQAIANQFAPLFDQCAPFMVDQFTKKFSGMEFREWFKETFGTFTYQNVRQMDVKTIYAVIELRKVQSPPHVAELLAQLKPEADLIGFIEEFMSDRPVDEDDADEDEPATPEVVAAPRQF